MRLGRIWGSRPAAIALGLSGFCAVAAAVQVSSLTPQGEVARVRQVVARFDEAAVRFGDAGAAAPLGLSCSDAQAAKGSGRWVNEKQWVFDFENDLPPGVRCTVSRAPGFTTPGGQPLTGPASWRFNTGGPFVRSIRPGGGTIDEEQVFLLQLNGAATAQSIRDNVWCAIEGLGERVPITLVEGEQRTALLQSTGLAEAAARDPQRFITLQCRRSLAPAARVTLVYGQGVATPSGVANRVERRYDYKVREPFNASFSCERENAQAGCLPLKPMEVRFNAPVPRRLAAQIVLRGNGKAVAPTFEQANEAQADALVDSVNFAPPFAEQASYSIEIPSGFHDASARPLGEPGRFPMKVATGAMPPLAKFAASPFGVIERLAEPGGAAMMPVTVRRVEPALAVQAYTPGEVNTINPQTDAEIIAWSRKLQRYEAYNVPRRKAREDVKGALPKVLEAADKEWVQSRMVSLLAGQGGVKTLQMPKAESDPRPFEVVGIPLAPGFHVLEIASRRLGDSLLDARYGDARTMYVRTSALATNLAVHFKLGRENSMAWVTTLDKGQVVGGARVRVSDCRGREVASAVTDANGVARFDASRISPEPPTCGGGDGDEDGDWRNAYFVSARAKDGQGVDDLAFTWSDWQRGIEPWRFNLPTSGESRPDRVAHTILDRMLLRAGETVSMKHLMRTQTQGGFGLPQDWPQTLVITHLGSGQQFKQPLNWRATAGGGRSSESSFAIPAAAKLGIYQVELAEGPADAPTRTYSSGQFRVEEFRLPVMEGRIEPADKKPLVAVGSLPTAVQVNYVAGGGAANLPVRVSALVKPRWVNFADYEGFSFTPPQRDGGSGENGDESARVVADKLPLTLDRNGAGQVTVEQIPAAPAPRELLLEASYADPNGEVQTLRSTQTLWPSQVIAGLKTEGWASVGQKIRFQALALDLSGKAMPDTAIEVKAISRITTTSRKRMVGGFYTYDNKTETKDLGTVCGGRSDSRGLLLCEARLAEPGQVELIAAAKDSQGRSSLAATSVYVTRQGELWFGGEDHDRIDLLPEKKNYQPGETAKFQVRMPFRFATALVSVEREGVIETQVVKLNGQDPTVQLQVKDSWGPNVFVSVLALRGRLREVPWYSFFTWGFKSPREWWTAFWWEGREYVAPTAMVDLSKPAYRLGATEIRVGSQAHQIALKVASDQPSYTVRGQAQITLTGTLPDGKPAANAEVAVAVVDQALLELMPNTSWNLLDAMLARRSWGVSTSTAQMEIVGRRHYGRKAVPAGGGGGKSATRELLDTLLLWNPRVVLDANGQAKVTVPLNDALTTFRIAAVAELGTGLFGTGTHSIQTTQDLQIISGLPPLVREDDEFRAQITLRNTTSRPMKVEASPRATLLTLAPQTVDVPAGEARELYWTVKAPAQLAATRAQAILWQVEARDLAGNEKARDALKVSQRIVPAVPVTVQQANLVQLDNSAPFKLDVAAPAGALPGRGGLRLALQPSLGSALPGVRDWFIAYPYGCLEQKTSRAIGLRDAKMWRSVVAQMPAYLDSDGLASYFPPREGSGDSGSDTLTAYLLAVTNEAAALDPSLALPDDLRAQMETGLVAFVEGRIERKFWSPKQDLDVRKLAALEALSRSGKAQGRMTTSLTIAPNQWPTGAVLDWIGILQRVNDVPQRQQRLSEAQQVLKARLSYQGTRMVFSTESEDNWWWLMGNADVNANRLLLAAVDDPAWKEDMGKLVAGALARQQRSGAWSTTTANLWGSLALEKFSRAFESEPVQGVTRASLVTSAAAAPAAESVDWRKVERAAGTDAGLRNNGMAFAWPAAAGKDTLNVQHEGSGKPWLTLQSTAAVPLTAPVAAGYFIKKTVTPVEQAKPGRLSRGDVLRVSLEVNATADMTWVAITDPIAGGSAILGSGLGRDSQIATQGENRRGTGRGWVAFEERSFEAYRAYYDYLPKGVSTIEYTVRLNNVGDFALPPTRVEALYAPEMYGMAPNARVKVEPAP